MNFAKHQLFVSLFDPLIFLFSISLISALILIIFPPLLALGLFYSYFQKGTSSTGIWILDLKQSCESRFRRLFNWAPAVSCSTISPPFLLTPLPGMGLKIYLFICEAE